MSLLSLKRVSAPASEPVSLAEAKAWLRVDQGFVDDDSLISGLITWARERTEDFLGRSLIEQTWRFSLDYFPCGNPISSGPAATNFNGVGSQWFDSQAIYVPRAPLMTVDSITYVAPDGTTKTLATSAYMIDADSEPARILPAYNAYWPAALTVPNAIKVTFTAGYESVPAKFTLAMQLFIVSEYEGSQEHADRAEKMLRSDRISSFDYSPR